MQYAYIVRTKIIEHKEVTKSIKKNSEMNAKRSDKGTKNIA